MGFGPFSSDVDSDVSSGTAGAQTEQGDPTAISIAGTGKKSNTNVNVVNNLSDQGAIDSAFAFAGGAFGSAVNTVNGALDSALEFAAGAFGAGADATANALDSVSRSSENVFAFAAGSLELNERVLEAGLDANAAALEFGEDVFSDSLSLAQLAITESNAARVDALEFGAGALLAQGQFAAASLNTVQTSSTRAFDAIEDSTEQFGDFAAGALQFITQAQLSGTQTLAEQSQAGLTLIAENAKSETTQSFDKLVKFAGIAFAGLAGVVLFSKMKGFA